MEKCSTGNLYNFLKSKKTNFIPQFEKNFEEQNEYYGYSNRRSRRSKLPVIYRKLERKDNWKTDLTKDITTAHLLSFALQIAQGMEYLSSVKCIHRDLAARNILLTPEGTVKISDFGLAKRIGYTAYYMSQSSYEMPCRWMSLESLLNKKFSTKSDIWSYGILLYEIFTLGELPYPNVQNDNFLVDEIAKGTRNDQPKYCPDVIYHHMALCWAVDKETRPSFHKSSELMKTHLLLASREVWKKVTDEFKHESERQKHMTSLRSKVRSGTS